MQSTNEVWLTALRNCMMSGRDAAPRGMRIKELIGYQTITPLAAPVLTVTDRKLGYRFMAAEAAWILSGDNRVSTISPYSNAISRFSDDGYFFHGAYGPMIRDQLHFIIDSLNSDPDTRQAVLTIWRPNPRPSKDIPCTVNIQFLIRNNVLHVIDTMRSSDLWLGWPYDVFNFSMLARYVICHLNNKPDLGILVLQAGSSHLYEQNWDDVERLIEGCAAADEVLIPWFEKGDDLIDWLWEKANGTGILETK
jgi:thymidylate synthase